MIFLYILTKKMTGFGNLLCMKGILGSPPSPLPPPLPSLLLPPLPPSSLTALCFFLPFH